MISLRPQSIDFPSSWENNCHSQLKSLFNQPQNSDKPISAIKLYSDIYELCISFPENHTMKLLKSIAQLFYDSASEIRQNIMNNFSGGLGSASLMDLYVKEWNRYSKAIIAINGVCRYLNKCLRSNYETAQYPSNSASPGGLHFQPVIIQIGPSKSEKLELRITSVEDVAISVWKNLILGYFRDRENNVLVNNFLTCLKDPNANLADLKLFIDSFRWCNDVHLIAMIESDVKEYYSKLSSQFMEQNSTSDYVLFAMEALSRETEKAKYLWESNSVAVDIITRICELELIEKHKEKLQEEFEIMLQSERINDMNILFKLLGKNEGTLMALQKCLQQLVIKDFDKMYDSIGEQSCQEIVNQVAFIYQKYVKFIEDAFNEEKVMGETLKESMSVIINHKIKRSWLVFSYYMDDLLKNDFAIDAKNHEILRLFATLSDKFDDFITDYKEKLAQRIIFNSVNVSREENVIETLKSVENFTHEQNCHLSRMIKDFKEKPDDSVLILTSHSWPVSCNPLNIESSLLPDSLRTLLESFDEEYREIHCGRRLQWCPQLMTLETENGTTMTLLQYQIISLLPFSSDLNSLTVKLGRTLNEISISLKSLQDFGVVIYDSLREVFEFSCIPSQSCLIPINGTISAEIIDAIMKHSSSGSTEINEHRQLRQSFITQSLITKILKRQRQASPAELRKLLLSAAGSLKGGHAFQPQVEEIDSAVNGLIDKGYLEFDEQEHLYIYIP